MANNTNSHGPTGGATMPPVHLGPDINRYLAPPPPPVQVINPHRKKARFIKVHFYRGGTVFVVPIRQLAATSEIFRQKLNSIHPEDSSQHDFHIAGAHPWNDELVFGSYLEFVDTGKLPALPQDFRKEIDGEHCRSYLFLCHLFLLGRTLSDSIIQDHAINAILATYRKRDKTDVHPIPCVDILSDVYQYTFPGCRLRRLMVDMYLWAGSEAMLMNFEDVAMGGVFLKELIVAMMDKTSKKSRQETVALARSLMQTYQRQRPDDEATKEVDSCKYHSHRPDYDCGTGKQREEAGTGGHGGAEMAANKRRRVE